MITKETTLGLEAWRISHPRHSRVQSKRNCDLKSKYGLTLPTFEFLAALQGYRCKICNYVRKLVVDHNHSNGEFRGLLCAGCNMALGTLEKNRLRLENYLGK